jgi:hypothetical protein
MNDDLRIVLEDALSLAKLAREELSKAPVVATKRGGGRVSPWLRVWSEAVQNACRVSRLLPKGEERKTLDDELAVLLEDDEPP